jgi:hypothetical protein
MLVEMKCTHIEDLGGGASRVFRKGSMYRVSETTGDLLCATGSAFAIERDPEQPSDQSAIHVDCSLSDYLDPEHPTVEIEPMEPDYGES